MPRIPSVISAQGTSATSQARPAPVRTAMARQHTGDRLTQNAQDEADKGTRASRACPLVDGNLIQGVSFTGGQAKAVAHLLGRKWVGYIVTKCSAPALFSYSAQAANLDASQITLLANASVVADVWVY